MNLKDNKKNYENNKPKLTINVNHKNESNKNNQNNTKIKINTKLDLNKIPLKILLHENLSNFEGDYFKKLYEEAEEEEKKELQSNYTILEEIILPNTAENKNKDNKTNQQSPPEQQVIIEQKKNEEKKPKKDNEENKENKKMNKNKKQVKVSSKSDNVIKEVKGIKYVKNDENNLLNNHLINEQKKEQKPTNKDNDFIIKKIYFEIKYDTQMGESMAIIGSIDKLGYWDINRALYLNWNEGNIWNTSFDYNEKNDFEYKFILIENGQVKEWENGINRKFIYQQIESLIEPNLSIGNIIKLKNILRQSWEYDHNNYSLKIISEWNKK